VAIGVVDVLKKRNAKIGIGNGIEAIFSSKINRNWIEYS
jgi:hypothetical protein